MFTDGKGSFFETEKELDSWEFVGALARLMKDYEENFTGTIILNPVQYKKYVEVVVHLKKLAVKYGGVASVTELKPLDLCGYASVQLPVLDEFGEGFTEFKAMLDKVDVVSVDVHTSGTFSIGINVNRVFEIVERDNKNFTGGIYDAV